MLREHTLSRSAYVRRQQAIFARAVASYRAAKRLTLSALAARTGCSLQQLHNIERQRCAPSWATYCALCRELGADPVKGLKRFLK